MRERSEFLTDREIFVLDHHPTMSYRAIGEELGVSPERVRQLKVYAERKIRDEKRREQTAARGQLPVTLTLRRKDLWVIIRGLEAHQSELLRPWADQRRNKENLEEDPDYHLAENLIQNLREILKG